MEKTERLDLIQPGEMLRLDFLEPMHITPYRLAKSLGVPATRVGDILHGRRDISPETGVLSCTTGQNGGLMSHCCRKLTSLCQYIHNSRGDYSPAINGGASTGRA